MEFSVPEKWSGSPVKVIVLAILTLFIAYLTYFSLENNIQIVFTHFYYIPIIIAAYWFDRKGVLYSCVLSCFYLSLVYTFSQNDIQVIFSAGMRVVVFIGISMVIAILSLTIRRKRVEIGSSEEQFRVFWETIQAGIILVDPKTHTIIAANPEAEKMTGYKPSEMTGNICHKFICPAEKGKCPISDLGMKVDRAERVLLTRDGKKMPVLKTVSEVIIGGKNLYIENFIDISPVKDAENALIAYIREATLRIRNPVELVRDNLGEIRTELTRSNGQLPHVATALAIQQKNMDDILKNLQDLERAIAERKMDIPDALREYLKR